MTRVANYAQFQRNLAHILEAQRRLADGQIQISSGRKSQNYAGIARDARRLVGAEIAHMRTSQYIENNNLIELRLQKMETTVSQTFDIASNYKTLLVNALNFNNSSELAMPIQAKQLMDQLTALLNVEDDGRFLFAGTMTNTEPVDQSGLPGSYTVPTSDGDANGYYKGDTTKLTVRVDKTFDVTYGVHAQEKGFERLMRSLHMIVIGPPNDRATLEDALKVVNQAIDTIPDLRTRIGTARATIEDVNQKHADFLLFSERIIGDAENADITEVITRMNADQLMVEASMMSLARMSQISLVRFLS